MTDAFEAYQKYLALKQHFTRDGYDYFKYGGKVSARLSSFESRKDRFFFYKLANFIDKDVSWVRDLLGTEAEQTYTGWLKRQQSLGYMFQNELDKLGDDLNDELMVTDGQHPKLLRQFLRNEISIETLVILNDILKFFKHWNDKIEERIIWNDVYRKCTKYLPFLRFDREVCKKALRERFT